MKDKYIIIITGKSGSGKTTFSNELAKLLSAELVNFDKISHKSLEDENIKNQIKNYFGNDVLDNNEVINRKKLGSVVFNNTEKLNFLNNLCQKYIENYVDRLIQKSNKKYVILEYALLPKMKYFFNSNFKILVMASDNIRHSRLIQRDGVSIDYLKNREKNLPEFKTEYFDEIIENNSIFLQNLLIFAEKIAKKIQTSTN